MHANYLDEAHAELDNLGLTQESEPIYHPRNFGYSHLSELLARTSTMSAEVASGVHRDTPAPRHAVGKRALDVLTSSGFVSFGNDSFICCRTAESKLIRSISDKSVEDRDLRSPLVITRRGEPVGVMKAYGEASFYGITDVSRYQIFGGAFAAIGSLIGRPKLLPHANHAWSAAIENLGSVLPLRLSLFVIPTDERNHAPMDVDPYSDVMTTSHEDVAEQVVKIFENSKPITDGWYQERAIASMAS
jgi:hypothetical protein